MNKIVSGEVMSYIHDYYRTRGLQYPDLTEAVMFAQTELAEVFELLISRRSGWVRNNPENKQGYSEENLSRELGDVIMMCMIAGARIGQNPLLSLFDKMEEKMAQPKITKWD